MPYILATADPSASTTAVDTIINAVGKVVEFSGTMLTAMVENPIYLFFLATGFVGVGLGIVRALRNTARG